MLSTVWQNRHTVIHGRAGVTLEPTVPSNPLNDSTSQVQTGRDSVAMSKVLVAPGLVFGTLPLDGFTRRGRRLSSSSIGDKASKSLNHVIRPWSTSFGDLWPLQLDAGISCTLRVKKKCIPFGIKGAEFKRHTHEYRIAASDSSSSSFPGSSGVDEVKNVEGEDDDYALAAERRRAPGNRKKDVDQESLDSSSSNGWGSEQDVVEAEFAERDHRSPSMFYGKRLGNMGEDGGRLISYNSDESSEDSWERYSEDSAGAGGDSSTSSSSSSSSMSSPGSPSVVAKEPVYEVIEINRLGKAVKKLVSRRQLLRTSGLRLRDLRRVDPSLWVTNSAPALLVREQAILLNLGSLRAIATPEDVLIFDHQSVGARGFIEILIPRLTADKNGYGHTVPFELEVMESALISRTQRLERALMDVEPRVISLLEVLPFRLTADVLEELRVSKQALVEVGAKAGALRDMLLELLENPQDIRRMTIMGSSCSIRKRDGDVQCSIPQDKQVAEDEEEEIEMLLEYYLQRCESCHGQAEKLLSSAKEMEDSIAVNLSSRRLEVSRLELLLQVGTFCAALGALVAGIFGMNLKSYLEERAMAFWITTAGIILGGTFLYIYIVSYLKNRKIL